MMPVMCVATLTFLFTFTDKENCIYKLYFGSEFQLCTYVCLKFF